MHTRCGGARARACCDCVRASGGAIIRERGERERERRHEEPGLTTTARESPVRPR
jgi:hypothetical protein